MNDHNKNKILENEFKVFVLQNLFIKKENEIFNLEALLKLLKNYKKAKGNTIVGEIHVHNKSEVHLFRSSTNFSIQALNQNFNNKLTKEEDMVLKKILTNDLDNCRTIYQKLTKNTISQKNFNQECLNNLTKLKKELENYKIPPVSKRHSNFSLINSRSCINTFMTLPSTKKDKELLKLNDNSVYVSANKNDEIFKSVKEELNVKLNYIEDLTLEIDQQKKANDKLEQELNELNNLLSDKFSLIIELEMKLDKYNNKNIKKGI
jgi:hypothetical protein